MTAEEFNQAELTAGRLTPEHVVELVSFWQENHHLRVDGKAGEKTLASLEAASATVRAPLPTNEVTGHKERAPNIDLAIDEQGWLRGDSVVHVPSPRSSPLDSDLDGPGAIVWHFTDTDFGTADNLARRISKAPGPDDREVSWHAIIAADGRIIQSVPCERGAWHAGGPTAKRIKVAGKDRRPNRCTAGIEIEGHGKTPLPAAQVTAAGRLLRAIGRSYGIVGRDLVLTHQEIDPTRRADPGPHWLAQLKIFAGLD
jgi:hypothetical protein